MPVSAAWFQPSGIPPMPRKQFLLCCFSYSCCSTARPDTSGNAYSFPFLPCNLCRFIFSIGVFLFLVNFYFALLLNFIQHFPLCSCNAALSKLIGYKNTAPSFERGCVIFILLPRCRFSHPDAPRFRYRRRYSLQYPHQSPPRPFAAAQSPWSRRTQTAPSPHPAAPGRGRDC